MKTNLKLICGTGAAVFLTGAALAQTNLTMDPTDTAGRMVTAHPQAWLGGQNLGGVLKATQIAGLRVKNYEGERLGKVEDLAVNVASGQVVQVIIASGGFLGLGSHLTAVPSQALHYDVANNVLRLNTTPERLSAAPPVDLSRWEELNASNQVYETYAYYNEPVNFAAPGQTVASTSSSGMRAMDRVHDAQVAQNNPPLAPWSGTGDIRRESKVVGSPVKNEAGQTIGRVENLVVDLRAARILAVVVATENTLAAGGDYYAIPPTTFQCQAGQDGLLLNVPAETLAAAPKFHNQPWPDFNQPDYDDQFYSAYHAQPYFHYSTNAPDANNTARNARDRDGRTMTPMDQGNSQADINTTAQIRSAIVADDSLSTDAHNIKIITRDGAVTLRGPVDSSTEKEHIVAIARRLAPGGTVNDQLEVVQATTMNN